MELIRPDININFVGFRFKAFLFSSILILLGIFTLLWRGGLNLGLDFAGGTLLQVHFEKPVTTAEVRDALSKLGISNASIQQVGSTGSQGGSEYLIRMDKTSSSLQSLANEFESSLTKIYGQGQVSISRAEMVGPKVGHDLRQKAYFAIYYALLFIAIYISGRFEFKWLTSVVMAAGLIGGIYVLQMFGLGATFLVVAAMIIMLILCWILKLPYALGAVVSLIHDVLITVGIFALLNKEFTLEVLAAILTLVGYSLNDTIIVYDRIRENIRKARRQDFHEVINASINQTLSRTILTSGTVFFVVLCLFIWGGSVIHDMSFALLIGIITGTYSSIFVASPILILYEDLTKGRSKAAAKKLPRGATEKSTQ